MVNKDTILGIGVIILVSMFITGFVILWTNIETQKNTYKITLLDNDAQFYYYDYASAKWLKATYINPIPIDRVVEIYAEKGDIVRIYYLKLDLLHQQYILFETSIMEIK